MGSEQDRAEPVGLSRHRLVAAALEVMEQDGLDGLSMRALAERLGVRAASLYWHVRDRRELLELIATAVLDQVGPPATGTPWRPAATAACRALDAALDDRNDLAELLVATPGVLDAAPVAVGLRGSFEKAGLPATEAASAMTMLLAAVVVGRLGPGPSRPVAASPIGHATVLVDTASIGVTLKAAGPGGPIAEAISGPDGEASVSIQGRSVVVRRPRAGGRSEVRLDPRYDWSVRVGGATSHTRLLLAGLRLRDLKVDSGAVRIDVVLPHPAGIVPIELSSGVTSVRVHRPRGTVATARVSSGVLRLRLDRTSIVATTGDSQWVSVGGDAAAAERYELRLNSGTIDVLLDQRAPAGPPPTAGAIAATERIDPGPAIELLLDGIAARVTREAG